MTDRMTNTSDRVEIITSVQRRCRWTAAECLPGNKLNDVSDLCFRARPEMGAADVDQREPRALRPQHASLPE